MSVITITFGDRAENHRGMQMIGKERKRGFTKDDLLQMKKYVEDKHDLKCKFVDLSLPKDKENIASLLIIRNAVKNAHEIFKEQSCLPWDQKAKMYGKVRDKKCRWNLTYDMEA